MEKQVCNKKKLLKAHKIQKMGCKNRFLFISPSFSSSPWNILEHYFLSILCCIIWNLLFFVISIHNIITIKKTILLLLNIYFFFFLFLFCFFLFSIFKPIIFSSFSSFSFSSSSFSFLFLFFIIIIIIIIIFFFFFF